MNKQKTILSRRPSAALSWVAAGCAAVLLAGCGTSVVSKGLNAEGVASEVVFPDIAGRATLAEGTFVNLDNLRAVGAGLSKDQLYALLGTPHLQEGMFGVREWDYIFNFRSGGGVTTCQYKVLFDKDYLARNFHWQPANCAAMLASPSPTASALAPVAAASPSERFQLKADALFAFDKSGAGDMLSSGRRQLDDLAGELKGSYKRLDSVIIIGHTDRLGQPAYNQRLSVARAAAVRDYLIAAGLPQGVLHAHGVGESQPVKHCNESLSRQALIECLEPNRRVELEVSGAR